MHCGDTQEVFTVLIKKRTTTSHLLHKKFGEHRTNRTRASEDGKFQDSWSRHREGGDRHRETLKERNDSVILG